MLRKEQFTFLDPFVLLGNGECINLQCVCGSTFSGRTCDCKNDNSTCIDPNGNPGELCSNVGQCVCGSCLCDDYVENRGQYCEECVVRKNFMFVL